jgi:hypothetical protein
MIDTVFMDVDGVLADFVRPAFAWHGRKIEEWPRCEWDICHHWGMSDKDFWKAIDNEAFWNSVAEYPDASWFIETLYSLCERAEASLVFCTQSSQNVQHFMPARMRLVQRVSAPVAPNVVITTRGKSVLAGPGKLLVDDNADHVRKFRDAGGQAILSPMHWNTCLGVKVNGKTPGLDPDYQWLLDKVSEEL